MADRLLGITATSESNTAADYMHAARWQAAESGTVTELRVYCGSSGNVKIAVYDDNSGVPGNRLAYDDSGQSVTAGAWRTLTISEFDVTQGEYYHIVHVIDTAGAVRRNNQAATGDRRYAASTYSTHTWPASLSGTSWSTADTAICSDAWGNIAGLSITDVDSDYGASSEEFDVDEDDLDINGSGFEASQESGTVYLADESTLAASDAEVDLENAVQGWSDTTINVHFGGLTSTQKAAIESLISSDGHSLYLIVVNDSAEENYIAVTVHRAKAFGLAASSYIAASGENTTARLAAPSGKTTGDFYAGRIQDDENPCDAINITDDDYTEIEWCIEALAGSIDGETYQFRLLFDGEVLDTYTVTPEVTISTGAVIEVSLSLSRNAAISNSGAAATGANTSLSKSQGVSSGGPANATSLLTLAKLILISASSSTVFESLLTLSRQMDISAVNTALSIAESTLSKFLNMVHSGGSGAIANMPLSKQLSVDIQRQIVLQAISTLAILKTVSVLGEVTADADVSLEKSNAFFSEGMATTNRMLALAKSIVVSVNSSAVAGGITVLSKQTGVSESALSQSVSELLLARLLGTLFTTGNYYSADTLLNKQAAVSAVAQASALASTQITIIKALLSVAEAKAYGNISISNLRAIISESTAQINEVISLANQKGISTAGGITLQTAISLALEKGITSISSVTIEGIVTLARNDAITPSGKTTALASAGLSRQLALVAIAGAVTGAGLSLASIRDITFTGDTILITVVTPDERIITVEVDNRVIDFGEDNRVVEMEIDNRVID